jgi:hypothetical protein
MTATGTLTKMGRTTMAVRNAELKGFIGFIEFPDDRKLNMAGQL